MAQHYDIQWLTDAFEGGASVQFLFFWGRNNRYNEEVDNFCFSQWYPSPFTVDGISYNTSEHWMMAQKALLFEDKQGFTDIITCETPAEAKN